MTIDANGGAHRRLTPATVSRTARRQDCLTGLLAGLTDIPHVELSAAFEHLPLDERDRHDDLAREIVDDFRASAVDGLRRRIAADVDPRQPQRLDRTISAAEPFPYW